LVKDDFMSIRQRIEDAVILDSIGRKDGALLSVLIAVAATSRLRYPEGTKSNLKHGNEMADGEAFQTFLFEESESIYGKGRFLKLSSPCPDPKKPTAPAVNLSHYTILYKCVRNELVHAAKLPCTIEFQRYNDGDLHTAYIETENKFVFSDSWLSKLIRVVVFSVENKDLFEKERRNNTILIRQKLPFLFTYQNAIDIQQHFNCSKNDIEKDFEAIFSHKFP
jgi:hypothetical protein